MKLSDIALPGFEARVGQPQHPHDHPDDPAHAHGHHPDDPAHVHGHHHGHPHHPAPAHAHEPAQDPVPEPLPASARLARHAAESPVSGPEGAQPTVVG